MKWLFKDLFMVFFLPLSPEFIERAEAGKTNVITGIMVGSFCFVMGLLLVSLLIGG